MIVWNEMRGVRTVTHKGRAYSLAEVTRVTTDGILRKARREAVQIARMAGGPLWFDAATLKAFPPDQQWELWRLYHSKHDVRIADDMDELGLRVVAAP